MIPFTIIDPTNHINDNIRRFIRMTPLAWKPIIGSRIRDEFDLIDTLDTISQLVKDTKSMLGKQKYRDQEYDFVRQVREDVEELLIGGRDPHSAAIAKHRNHLMYRLVVEPFINNLAQYEHVWIVDNIDILVNEMIEHIKNCQIDTTMDDAELAREEAAVLIERLLVESNAKIKAIRQPLDPELLVEDEAEEE